MDKEKNELESNKKEIVKWAWQLGKKLTIIVVYIPSDHENVALKGQFFEKLHDVIAEIGNMRVIILMGDCNSRMGRDDELEGKFCENCVNDNVRKHINPCKGHWLITK